MVRERIVHKAGPAARVHLVRPFAVLRFLDVTHSYSETSGGIRTYLDAKRRHLLQRTPHEHVLVVPAAEDSLETGERWRTHRLAGPRMPSLPYRFFARLDRLSGVVRDEAADVVELADFLLTPWPVLRRRDRDGGVVGGFFHADQASAYAGAPVRGAARELPGELTTAVGLRLGDRAERVARHYSRSVYERCDLLFAATPGMARTLADYGVRDTPVHVVPLGVDAERFHPRHRDPRLRAQWGAGEDTVVLVYGGRLDSEKRATVIADAFARLPPDLDARLVMRGEGPLRAALEARARSTPGMHVGPYEPDPTAFARLLASADVYVTAGPHETFALSVVEAQASGLPVVGVRAGALPERVPPQAGRLVEVGDADAMAAAIAEVAASRTAMGSSARRHAEACWSWSATFERLVGLYEEEVERRRPGGAHAAAGLRSTRLVA